MSTNPYGSNNLSSLIRRKRSRIISVEMQLCRLEDRSFGLISVYLDQQQNWQDLLWHTVEFGATIFKITVLSFTSWTITTSDPWVDLKCQQFLPQTVLVLKPAITQAPGSMAKVIFSRSRIPVFPHYLNLIPKERENIWKELGLNPGPLAYDSSSLTTTPGALHAYCQKLNSTQILNSQARCFYSISRLNKWALRLLSSGSWQTWDPEAPSDRSSFL